MADALNISVQNLDQVLAELRAYPQDAEKIINNEFRAFGLNTTNTAKRYAPVDEGRLRESIGFTQNNLEVTINVNVDYAAYLEFGTKSFAEAYVATLPPDWQTFAAQYRGPAGGSFHELVMRITEWVKRKGFAAERTASGAKSKSLSSIAAQNSAAYAIALSIVRKGIRPHPYLAPAFEQSKIELINHLKRQLNAKS
jgi:HK97 gp10 family phage protein